MSGSAFIRTNAGVRCPGGDKQLAGFRVTSNVIASCSGGDPKRFAIQVVAHVAESRDVPKRMMCQKKVTRDGSSRQPLCRLEATRSTDGLEGHGAPNSFVIRADSSPKDWPEGAESEAPGERGAFRVTDTTPESVLCFIFYLTCTVWFHQTYCVPLGLGLRQSRHLLLTFWTSAHLATTSQ